MRYLILLPIVLMFGCAISEKKLYCTGMLSDDMRIFSICVDYDQHSSYERY